MPSLPLKTVCLLGPIADSIDLMLSLGELLSVGPTDKHGEKPVIHALAASEHRLYVAAGGEFKRGFGALFRSRTTGDDWWSLYRSTDQGESWYPIDPWERQERETGRAAEGSSIFQYPSTTGDR